MVAAVLALAAAAFLASQFVANRHFEITYYQLATDKFEDTIKIVLMSDLHDQQYGPDNQELIQAVAEEKPDMILMAGDMVNASDDNVNGIRALCRELLTVAPIYYGIGNHEGAMTFGRMDSIAIDRFLEEDGVCVLYNDTAEFQKGDTIISIAGISTNVNNYDKWSRGEIQDFWLSNHYKILLSHYPKLYYEKLRDAQMDLAVAGHYHGGLIRLPFVGGLFHPEAGFFPQYDGGCYQLTYGTLIVTRGIGNHGLIPRINNRPELVVITIN